LGDFVAFKEWEQLLRRYPVKQVTLLTSGKLYPLDTASLITGPLEVLKRCQGKPDIDLDITMGDVLDACKKIL